MNMACRDCFTELRKPKQGPVTEAEIDAYSPLPSGRGMFSECNLRDVPAWYLTWWVSQRKLRQEHPETTAAVARHLGRLFATHRGWPTGGVHDLEAADFLI
jgi:hypothetical protein